MLIGFNQKVHDISVEFPSYSTADTIVIGEQTEPKLLTHGKYTERGKPVIFPKGKQPAKEADEIAGITSWKKRRPSCNGMDKG